MAITWERLEGDTSVFAIKFAFQDDPDRGSGAASSLPGSRELVMDVASSLQTSFTATVEHMYNLGLISDEEWEALFEERIEPFGPR